MKHSDRPVYRPKDDLLGRAKFSLFLARAIDNLSLAKDGFVIAVMGEWGAGKSSVVEMTARYLTHLEMERACKGSFASFARITSYVGNFEGSRPYRPDGCCKIVGG